jgi:hypothetical protein
MNYLTLLIDDFRKKLIINIKAIALLGIKNDLVPDINNYF